MGLTQAILTMLSMGGCQTWKPELVTERQPNGIAQTLAYLCNTAGAADGVPVDNSCMPAQEALHEVE